jgi:hypothetical protein
LNWGYRVSYLSELDEAFTWISKKVLQEGVLSIVSYQPAQIVHHLERRLTNPSAMLDSYKLVPLTAREHDLVHSGRILLLRGETGSLSVRDELGARFVARLNDFYEAWQRHYNSWITRK